MSHFDKLGAGVAGIFFVLVLLFFVIAGVSCEEPAKTAEATPPRFTITQTDVRMSPFCTQAVLVIKDAETGREYLAMDGFGIAELPKGGAK